MASLLSSRPQKQDNDFHSGGLVWLECLIQCEVKQLEENILKVSCFDHLYIFS